MATSATHRGWKRDHNYGLLAAVYNGAQPGTAALAANTAADGILIGTPVITAIPVDSLVLSNTIASGDLVVAMNDGSGNSWEYLRCDASAALMVVNEASSDIDFRVETDGMAYAIASDGGKNALVLGSNTDTSSADQLITVSRAARTATASTSYYDLRVAPAGAVTVPAGTTAIVATASLVEPNVTATGTVTRACTLHIASQPTEGATANAAIYFEAAANIACTTSLTFNEDSEDIDFRFETNNMAYAIYSDGGKDALVLGSNTDTSSVDQLITVSRAARTATASTSYYDMRVAPAGAVTVPAGTTAVVATMSLVEPNVTATGTVTRAATLHIASQPTEGATANAAIYFEAAANIAGTTSITINDDSEDLDFRIESNSFSHMFYVDGGKDALVIGAASDLSAAAQLVTIGRGAKSTAASAYYDLVVSPATAVTTTGTGMTIATARFTEPLITVSSGTVTNAATVLIADAPTEGGTGNYALWVDAGTSRFDGDLDLSDGAVDVVMKAATAAALEISDATTKFYAFDTRVATAGVTTHALDISDYTFASGATNVATGLSLAAHTLNYTGATQVTTQVDTVVLGARTIVSDTATLTVDEANTLLLVAPTEGASNTTLAAASALRIVNAGGTPTNQYGIYIEDLTVGATADYGIYIAGADTAAIYVASADPIHLGVAGTSTGKLEIDGATSGTMTLTVPAATTSYTLTLPDAANTNVGYQLTCAAGDTITSWGAAASSRALKNIMGQHDTHDALDKILATKVYDFHYLPGKGTQDDETNYVGVMSDEAPWAMHYKGGVVNPVNTFGYTVLAFQAMAERINVLEKKLARKGARA